MNHKNLLSTEKISSIDKASKRKSAFRIATTGLGAAVLSLAFTLLLAVQSDAWQLYALAVLAFAIGIAAFSGLRFILDGRFERGMWMILAGTFVVIPLVTLMVSGVGLILGLVLVSTSYFYASQTLPAKDIRRILVAGLGIGLLTATTDLFKAGYRLQVPALQTFVPFIAGLVFLVVVFFLIRETWKRSIRNKLLMSFMGVTVVSAGTLAVYVFMSTTNILHQGLERELVKHTDDAALRIGALLSEQINTLKTLSLNEILEQAVKDSNQAYPENAAAIQAELDAKDAQWRAADVAFNNFDPLVQEHLSNQAALELNEFQEAFPNHVEIFVTDLYGGLTGSTNRTSDYYQADEQWWQAAYNNGQGATYISEPEFDESTRALAILIAVPVRSDETGEIIGILRTTYLISALNTILDEKVGKTGDTELFVPGEVVFHFHKGQYTQVESEEYAVLQALANQDMVKMDYEGAASVVVQAPIRTSEGNSAVNNLGWLVLFHQDQADAFAPVNTQIRGAFLVMALVAILAVLAAFFLSLLLVRPIAQLIQTAEEVAAGNLNSRASVASSDEIGILAATFNRMTTQLQETLQGLEQRVAARTRDLEIVAEVGTATATILESQKLLQKVVDLTKERFNLYHSHIYLLDEEGQNLVLAAGAGEPGRQMLAKGLSIPLHREQSLVARAARERKGVTVNDVTQAPDFLPNPLLPNTRSELAVPMIVGARLIGVFDIQSEQVGRFTQADVNIQMAMAAQLATSIQNVRSFERAKVQAEFEAQVSAINQKIQRATSVEDTLQTAIREIGMALGAMRVSASISANRKSTTNSTSRS